MIPQVLGRSAQTNGQRAFYQAMLRLFVCRNCGRSGQDVRIDLDHINPADMVCRISDFFYNRSRHVTWAVVAAEMLKVQPLCRQCHLRKNGPIDIGQLALFESAS